MDNKIDKIDISKINNLYQLFCARVHRTPNKIAYKYFDSESQAWLQLSWSDMADHIARWQFALKNENLNPGDRVAIMVNNCPEWVMFEQASLGLGLVVVPLYINDRAENVYNIIEDSGVKLLFIIGEAQWSQLKTVNLKQSSVEKVISLEAISGESMVTSIHAWLPDQARRFPLAELDVHGSSLATIVYTSGTTGKPKGVMLSHRNILWNADAPGYNIEIFSDDVFLSFLPLSHSFERTIGYYLPMLCGCVVAYAQSIEKLAEDLVTIQPTVLITVPRIFERVYNKISIQLQEKPAFARKLFNGAVNTGWHRFLYKQGKAGWHPSLLLWPLLYMLVGKKIMSKMGGRMRLAVSGGAPLNADIARIFIGLGLTISQGYGMTELSPVVCTNFLEDNDPASVGQPLHGVNIKLAENNELCVRSPGIMLGYWNNEKATREIIDEDGWLHTGDIAKIIKGHIYITGRLKEILVLSNGEKVPPADIEMAIAKDPLFEQCMVIGEQKPYLSALLVFNESEWEKLAASLNIKPVVENLDSQPVIKITLQRVQKQLEEFPGYANIYRVKNLIEPWTIENGMITPTMKLKRQQIQDQYQDIILSMYEGH